MMMDGPGKRVDHIKHDYRMLDDYIEVIEVLIFS